MQIGMPPLQFRIFFFNCIKCKLKLSRELSALKIFDPTVLVLGRRQESGTSARLRIGGLTGAMSLPVTSLVGSE